MIIFLILIFDISSEFLNQKLPSCWSDKKFSLVMELKDDSKDTFDEAVGLSTYSSSISGVLSYFAIFENLWVETELYEQTKNS